MTYEEYDKLVGFTSTLLSRFWESPDHALLKLAPSPPLEQGVAFERLLEDRVKGTSLFGERFFECDIGGSMPQDLPQWIFDGEDLSTKYRLKKGGERNNQSKTLHMYLDACQGNPGKIPIGKKDADMLGRAVNNMLKMKIEDISDKYTVEDILKEADFQAPLQWEVDGIKKKALVDAIVKADDLVFLFDFKLYASFSNFRTTLKGRGWCQAIHYKEGCEATYGPTESMWFLVASKEEPYLAKSFQIDQESEAIAKAKYAQLCADFVAWDAEGRNPKGWLPSEYVKIWFR